MAGGFVPLLFVVAFQTCAAQVICNTGCPRSGGAYNVTCQSSEAGTCDWKRDNANVMSCGVGSAVCVPASTGVTGFKISDKFYILQIDSFTSTSTFECQLGAFSGSCTAEVVTDLPAGSLAGNCVSDVITCSGLTNHGTPAVTLQVKYRGQVLASTTKDGSVSSTQDNAADETFTCAVTGPGAACMSTASVDVVCPESVAVVPVLAVTVIILVFSAAAVLLVFIFKNEKLLLTLIIAGVVLLCTGIPCTAVIFALSSTGTSLASAAAAFSVICLLTGIGLSFWAVFLFIKHN